jgi:hypothetical protein
MKDYVKQSMDIKKEAEKSGYKQLRLTRKTNGNTMKHMRGTRIKIA